MLSDWYSNPGDLGRRRLKDVVTLELGMTLGDVSCVHSQEP